VGLPIQPAADRGSKLPTPGAAEEWRQGWKIVFASFVGFSFFSVMTTTLGVFMGPLTDEFGWSRSLISAGVTIAAVVTGLLSPFFGILIDRYGSRRLALPGLVAAALAISSFGLANGSAVQWLVLWTVYAVISISVKTTVWTAAVVGAFTRAQGLALGVVLSGTAAAQIIGPPLATWLIDEFGWRLAYVWLGAGWGSLTLIICTLFLFEVRDRRSAGGKVLAPPDRSGLHGLSIQQAVRSTALWRIGLSTFIVMLLTIGLQIHQIPILIGSGVSPTNAAWLASLSGAAGIVGKLVSGVLLDRFQANWVGGLTLGVAALAFLFLIDSVQSPPLIVIAMVVNGYAAGSKLQITSYLTSQYAGLRHFGVIYGAVISLVTFGSGLGPLVAGGVYDATGSYTSFLIAGTIGCFFCGLLILSLPEYPNWTEREEHTGR
jgi:predicted MFS family arabinose efflux permease